MIKVHEYSVVLNSDTGVHRVTTWATSADAAINNVRLAALAPLAAVKAVYRNDVTPKVDGKCGSPLGRANCKGFGINRNRASYSVHRVRVDRVGYDKGGAYWGLGLPVYAVQDGAGNIAYVRAETERAAINIAGNF